MLQEALAETQGLIRPRPDEAIDFLDGRYSYLRQFVPLLLHTLTLRAQGRIIPYSERLRCSAISIVCQRGGRCQKMHLWRS